MSRIAEVDRRGYDGLPGSVSVSKLSVYGLEIPWDVQTLDGFREWVASMGEDAPRVHFYRGRVHLEMSAQSYGKGKKGHNAPGAVCTSDDVVISGTLTITSAD